MQNPRAAVYRVVLALSLVLPAVASARPSAGVDEHRWRSTSRTRFDRDSLRVAAALAAAERYAIAGKTAEARRRYRDALAEQTADGGCTAETHWLLAMTHFADGDELASARALDAAASAATECADPAMELRATFEAVVLYAAHGRPDQAIARMERVRQLLKSPVIPADQKAGVRRRIAVR